jgi:hypothetical protein
MEHRLKLNLHMFDFQHFAPQKPKSFRLRLSLLRSSIPEHKMIKGSQPLAGYSPKEFRLTQTVTSGGKESPNQVYSFDVGRSFNPLRVNDEVSIDNSRERGRKGSQEDPSSEKREDLERVVVVAELLMKVNPNSIVAKNFEVDSEGFANIGHNMLEVECGQGEVHETTQLVFDEVTFCSVGLAVHLQTSAIVFRKNLKPKHSKCSISFFRVFRGCLNSYL